MKLWTFLAFSDGVMVFFILWFGWFGFNPGSQLAAAGSENASAISHIFITTNLAAAAGAVTAMAVTWMKYKRPGLSITLNGALAGLVAITAGCDVVSPGGAAIIGIFAGILLVFGVEFIDKVLRVDDPVGAISVHGSCGIWGIVACAIFDNTGSGYTLIGQLQENFGSQIGIFVMLPPCRPDDPYRSSRSFSASSE